MSGEPPATFALGGIWLLTLCAAIPYSACVRPADPSAFARKYAAVHRSGHVDKLLAMHADDAEFLIPGQKAIRGMAAHRDLFEWDVVLESDLHMDSIRVHGDTIVVDELIERNQWFRALGLSEVRHLPGTRLVLRQGRIVGTYPSAFDERTLHRLLERFGLMKAWLSANRPDALPRWSLPLRRRKCEVVAGSAGGVEPVDTITAVVPPFRFAWNSDIAIGL